MSGPLFTEDAIRYPQAPGAKARDTSFAAAEGMRPKAAALRERVLAAIRARPRTPEEVALFLSEPLMNIRPRCSELSAQSLIVDSGERRAANGGRKAIVWRAARVSP